MIPWYVIVQHYSTSTDLFNSVDIVGPFDDADTAEAWVASQGFNTYVHYTITTPNAPYPSE